MKIFKKPAPHDPLDDLLAAALLDELTPQERAHLELRLETDPAARAAYQETIHMHDLLEKNYRHAQPDPAFEDRIVSGVRRKLRGGERRETAWESLVVLWRGLRGLFSRRRLIECAVACCVIALLASVALGPITGASKSARKMADAREFAQAQSEREVAAVNAAPATDQSASDAQPPKRELASSTDQLVNQEEQAKAAQRMTALEKNERADIALPGNQSQLLTAGQTTSNSTMGMAGAMAPSATSAPSAELPDAPVLVKSGEQGTLEAVRIFPYPTVTTRNGASQSVDKVRESPYPPTAPTPTPTRKLIRNAQLNLEVKNFPAAIDAITAQVKACGGYVDSSNSQRGGNGKFQGTVVVKVLPENLDAFLLQLRMLGEIKNQSVSTDDVTKAYYDTQARLDNARRMETQLQGLLLRSNSEVSDLLEVERELGRVRGEIEQMQGELKLYDFEVQYATITIAVAEKDLTSAAAYLLRERDDFSLFASDVESAFAQARQAATDFKGEILNANLSHNSGSEISATLLVSVPPDQIDAFLARVKTLGRIDNFTRQTERVANDGGTTADPADNTKTDKDRVTVSLTIAADVETAREETQLSVVAADGIEAKARAAKNAAEKAGAAVTASSFQRDADGTESADLAFRLPLNQAPAFLDELKRLGRVDSLAVHRNDAPGTTADDRAPAEISLHLASEPALVADDNGLLATLRRTGGEGIAAFLGSVRTIGVLLAFALPWLVTLVLAAWIARRIYIARSPKM